jgi:transposase
MRSAISSASCCCLVSAMTAPASILCSRRRAIDGLIADQAFDNNAIRKTLAGQGALALIPSKADRKTAIPHDVEMYKWRHLIENDFAKIKAYRRIAPRYDKTDASVEAMIRARSVSSVKKRST